MSDSSKIKVLMGLAAVLIVLNVALLGYMWSMPRDGRHGPHEGRPPAGIVIKELQFDDVQQKQFEQLRDAHHGAMIEIEARDRSLHDQLYHSLVDSSASSHRADSLMTEITKADSEKEQVTYHHLAQIRQMCTAAQQKIFDNMIAKAMARTHRAEGPPPRD